MTGALHSRIARNAFTLTELLIVVAAIGALTLIAVSRFGHSRARYRVEAAGRRVIADLTQARAVAQASSRSITVDFVPKSSSYTLIDVLSETRQGADAIIDLTREPYGVVIASADFGGDSQFSFDSYGRPSSAGSMVFLSGRMARRLDMDATGNVSSRFLTERETADAVAAAALR